jgi:hypothetical protein
MESPVECRFEARHPKRGFSKNGSKRTTIRDFRVARWLLLQAAILLLGGWEKKHKRLNLNTETSATVIWRFEYANTSILHYSSPGSE